MIRRRRQLRVVDQPAGAVEQGRHLVGGDQPAQPGRQLPVGSASRCANASTSARRPPGTADPAQPHSTVRSLSWVCRQMPWSMPYTTPSTPRDVAALAVGVVEQHVEDCHPLQSRVIGVDQDDFVAAPVEARHDREVVRQYRIRAAQVDQLRTRLPSGVDRVDHVDPALHHALTERSRSPEHRVAPCPTRDRRTQDRRRPRARPVCHPESPTVEPRR